MKSLYTTIYATILFMLILYSGSYRSPNIVDFTIRLLHAIDLWSLFAFPVFVLGVEVMGISSRQEGGE